MKLEFVYVLCAAAHLAQVLSSGAGTPAFSVDILLNSSAFQTEDSTVYDFGPGDGYYLLFSDECPNDTFSINPNTGKVSITKQVEFPVEEQEPVCVKTSQGYIVSIKTYNCFAVIETTTQSYGVLMVIHVLSNSPSVQIQFQKEFYRAEVMEGVQGAPVLGGGGIQAISLPIAGLLTPSYRILNGYGPFTLSEYNVLCTKYLQIHTTQALDREIEDYYEIRIEAYTAETSANTTILISVLDMNDNKPEFQQLHDSATVSDGSLSIGESVAQFQASDGDLGLNARLFYSLASLSSQFTMNPFTGSLFRYSSEGLHQTTQTVGVSDLGSPQHGIQANFTIFIDNEHQQLPVIHDLGSIAASESETIDDVVSTIHITYSAGSVVVSLESFYCNCFRLSEVTGNTEEGYSVDLLVNFPLDFESFPFGVIVTITAVDAGNSNYATSTDVNITISDENEPPVFLNSEHEISIPEGTPIGSEIFRVSAVDHDTGSNGQVSYTFTDAPENNPFSLDSISGIISPVSTIDYEALESVDLTILAMDEGGETDQMTLKITILDRNDQQPSFTNTEQTVTVSETILANDSILSFAASDGDSQCNGAITYSIIHAEPPLIRIDPISGLLYPLEDNSIDFEQFQSAVIVVRANDLGERSEFVDTTLHINIEGANDEPPQLSSIECPCFMIEATSTTQTCQPLSAYDADSSQITFAFHSGNEENLFSINSDGIVSTTEALPYEEGLVYNMEIIASDGELESEPEILTIIVVDKDNVDPSYGDEITITKPVDTPTGSLIGNVGVQQGDSGFNALTEYKIITGGAEDVIRIDSLSGNLYLNSTPQAGAYSFSVTATDALHPGKIATASVSIQFSGERNNPPHFQTPMYHINIASNSQTGEPLYTFSAEDDDSGTNGMLTYNLETLSTFFEVDSGGSLMLSQSLSTEVGSEFTLMILVSDGGAPSLQDTLEVSITVYESSINLGGETFTHNPGITVHHYFAEILEGTSQSVPVFSLPETEGGNLIQYAILPQGNFFTAFRIQNQNEVFVKLNFQHIFDHTQNEAVFITLRAQYSSNFHYISLTVIINDINNNGPQFSQDQYTAEIYRNTPEGGYIFEFDALDPDVGSNAVTTYTVDPPSEEFSIVQGTTFLKVTTNNFQDDVYSLTIVATDAESTTLPTDTTTLTITILDTSNTPPLIDSMTYTVSESATVGNPLGDLLQVTDTDSGVHGNNILCIASGNEGNQFQLSQSGNIIPLKELDYETMSSFTLSIMAYDSSLNPASSVTQVQIVVENDNDEPTFVPDNYFATIVENNPTVTSVLTVTAFDADSGDTIEYSIQNGTTAFSIDPMTGVVSTKQSLNRESVTQHSILVSATDAGGKTSLASVLVRVLDENDNDPTFFSPNFATVSEDMPVGSEVIRLEALDDDEGQNGSVKFEIVSGNEANIFVLNPFTGSVTLGSSLDFETDSQSLVVTFSVSDVGFPPRTSSVTHQITFSIENANDNFPVFSASLYSCTILEGSHDFTESCQVSATDVDEDDVTFMIVSGNADSAFQVNSISGLITRQKTLDREDVSRYFLKVKATDSGSPSLRSFSLVVIDVEDENDDIPKFDPVIATHIPQSNAKLSQMYFSELLPSNTLLFYAHAVDNDIGVNGEISYSITSDNSDLFYINTNTSAVFLTGNFDYETATRHVLQIKATNPSGTSTLQTYAINILNENENLFPPVFFPDTTSAASVSVAASAGTLLTHVNATDSDPGRDGDVRYYITGGSGYGYFTIDQFHGDISVLYGLTGIENSDITLEIQARDLGIPSLSSSFTVVVFLEPDDGAKPFFTSAMYNAFASEAFAAQNSIFASVQALVDSRATSDITYSIVSEKFSINASSGAISTVGILDREGESMYTLLVSASRGSTINTSYTLLAIEVSDSNDHTPAFEISYDVTIFNNHPTGVENAFMRVFAIDQDAGQNSRLEYSITSGSSIFSIDSNNGDLYLLQSLPSNSYELTVSVTDMGALPLSRSTMFTVTSTSPASSGGNNAPVFASLSFPVNLPEDTAPGSLIYTAEASDSSDDHIVYRIIQPLPNFAIMPNTGEVYLIKPLDREEDEQYTIRIEASDGSLTSSTFLLNIFVTDVNDNRPEFTTEEFLFTVEEHSSTGVLVGSITATDLDDETGITYSLVDSKDHNSINLFSLSDDGMLEVAGDIDRETNPVHLLTVSAEDHGTPSLTTYARVKILVTDINDNMLAFVSPLQNVSISEDITVATPFFHLVVFDPDNGVQSSLSYSLSPETTPFAVNESTGELYVSMQLDADKQTNYSLEISVSSEDAPTDIATTTLIVTVTDELDSLPALIHPGNVIIPENMPPYSIVAFVGDNVSLSAVYYEIISGNEEHAFFIEPLTGIVRTSVALDRESSSSYTLTVQGSFQINHEASVTFTVSVSDVNDKAPTFTSHFLEYTLNEDSTVSELDFTDNDEVTNNQISGFYIPDPIAAETFEVDSSGDIRVLEALDREDKFDAIDFDLYIIDSGKPPLHDMARISIRVSDVNDNPPSFLQSSYSFTISLPVIVDTTLFGVQAMDLDKDSTIRYAITGGNGTNKFSINAITGDITVSNNYKLQAYYTLTVSAQDEGGEESSVSVNITTKYCGFMNLLFNPREMSEKLFENVANGTVVFSPTLLTFDMPASIQYSFSTVDSLFQINENTGVVSLNGHLNRERQSIHQFTIQARDLNDPLRIAQADIEIIVDDVNDNAPVFLSAPYVTYVTGNYSGEIIRVRAVDSDEGSNGEVRYELNAVCSGLFKIEENTGQISVTEALDTLFLDTCTLTVVASDKGRPPMSETTTVTVNVVLSNAPLFTMSGVYSAEVSESAARDTLVITVVATSTSDNSQIRYNIESPQSNTLPFSIDFTRGDVTVNGIGLDYETNSSYRLQLEAVDLSTSLTGRATLDIQVLDENDNRPEFSQALYQSSLTENTDIGTPVQQVSASDLDSGSNSQITYFIDPNDIATTLFNIDERSGWISTSGGIDREENDFIRISVLARDAGSPSLTGTTIVQIEVIDVNDNAPAFLQSLYQGTILEDDQPGTSILFVTATDPDDEDEVEYEIVTTEGSSNFGISSNGLITLATSASELVGFQYQLNVSAFDGLFYSYTEVIVELENENNNAPMFNATTYSAFVLENAAVGTEVVQVFATDNDRGTNGEVTYSMSSNLFAVSFETGIITVSAELDREANPNGVTLIVIARDGGGRTGTAEVDIELGDINDNAPVFSQAMYGFDVLETTEIGTTVSTVVMATDPDSDLNGLIQYTLNPSASDPTQFPFAIDEQTGAIRTILEVDPMFQDEYVFTVSAVDMGTPVMTAEPSASVTVHIIAAGQVPPHFENVLYQVEIHENNQYGAPLPTPLLVMTNETIECDVITYSLLNNDGNLFQIANSMVSTITVTTILNREEMAMHTFTIQAECLPVESSNVMQVFAVITVTVLDVNEPPTFSSAFLIGSILENIQLGTILEFNGGINSIEADDEDAGQNGNIVYSINEDVPFVIGLNTGIITVSGNLDRETTDTYRFDVIATDLGNPPLSSSIRIRVEIDDTNDSPPVFEQSLYHGEVTENAAIGTSIVTVTASDEDLGEFAINTYSISGSDVFRIGTNTGEITVFGEIDRETTPIYAVVVTASDGINQDSTTVTINVTDINDNPPIFNDTQYEIVVEENYETGVGILQVFATDIDLDENAEIRYGILEDQELIQINSTTGEVSFYQSPDYEMSPQGHFEFRVTATNPNDENQRDLSTVVIDLVDLNDNAPQFANQETPLQVSENRPSGVTVVRVVADDLDSGLNARVQYSLSEESQEFFSIDSQTGTIQTLVSFNREANSTYEISVIARDLGMPPMSGDTTLLVAISDENDNPPVFSQRNYTVSVLESESIGSEIINIRADDADEGINAEIMYRLTGDNSAHFTLMMLEDGSVNVLVDQELNRENIDKYYLNIIAFDGGFPFLQATVPLTIVVQDENDNPPVFDPPFYAVEYPESLPMGSEIVRVFARDPDSAAITQLTYSIADPGSHTQFEIDPIDGRISLAQPLDFEEDQVHNFIVQADDQVNNLATASVSVTVTNVNDNAPEFVMPNFTTSITENEPRHMLFDFIVHDRDRGSDPRTISFKIESGNTDNIFNIEPTSGILTVNSFDFEALTASDYLLTITASDNEEPPLAGTAYVTVNVQDINDNPPVGEDQVFYVVLYNGQLTLTSLGNLLIRDPDTVNDHQFTVTGGDSDIFQIELGGGIDILLHPPPPGTYSFTVHVTDGTLGNATTVVDITVVNITDAHLAHSFTMTVEANSAVSFLDANLQQFLRFLEDLVTDKTGITSPKAYLFNITDSGNRRVDISLVVESEDGIPVHPNLVQHLLHINRDEVQAKTGVAILTENVDHCADEFLCPLGTFCSETYEYSSSTTVMGSAAASLLGIDIFESIACSNSSLTCSVACPEPSLCVQQNGQSVCIDDCTPNPCKNNGKCQNQMPGYYCSCPSGFDGRNCELTTSYFQEGSYAILPAVTTATNGTITLEFVVADREVGLLCYSSRFDNGLRDFISLEIINSHLSLLISYGGNSRRISLPLNGAGWYLAAVDYTETVSFKNTKIRN